MDGRIGTLVLDAPSDAIDGAAGVIHADKVVEQWASACAATTLTRAEFTRVEGLKVSKGCVVAHAGVPVAAFLDEAACAEDAPTFAKRLDNAPVLADAVEFALWNGRRPRAGGLRLGLR